jgi:predicted metal-dependent peptidase
VDRALRQTAEAKVDWRDRFQRAFAATIPNDYSWMRPNRRLIHAGLYLPGISREGVGELVTRIAQGGIDLVTLAALLGHESIRLVQKYVHPTAEHKKSAMARYDRMIRKAEKTSQRKSKSLSN